MQNKCTSKEFAGRRDPYTGDPLEVWLHVMPGGNVLYRFAGGYDVAAPHPTMEGAVSDWSRVDGIVGARSSAGGFVCAYTGRMLRPDATPGAACFAGGFSPQCFHTRDEVLAVIRHLDGRDAPGPDARVDAVFETPPAPRFHGIEATDEAARRAEGLVGEAKHLLGAAPASPVSMHVPGKSGRRRPR